MPNEIEIHQQYEKKVVYARVILCDSITLWTKQKKINYTIASLYTFITYNLSIMQKYNTITFNKECNLLLTKALKREVDRASI